MKTIEFQYDGKTYQLGFNRMSVRKMEDEGFNIQQLVDRSMTMIPMLFHGAFQMRHKGIKRELTDEIWKHIDDKGDMLAALAQLYADTIEDLLKTEENDAKKIKWKMGK